VDVSLVDSVFASLENIPQKYYVDGLIPERIGNRYEFVYPYGTFEARDGWVVIGIANDTLWLRFLEVTGLPIKEDRRFSSNPLRVENYKPLKTIIENWCREKTKNEIVNLLIEAGVPCCPIFNIKEVSEDPHIQGVRNMVLDIEIWQNFKNQGLIGVEDCYRITKAGCERLSSLDKNIFVK